MYVSPAYIYIYIYYPYIYSFSFVLPSSPIVTLFRLQNLPRPFLTSLLMRFMPNVFSSIRHGRTVILALGALQLYEWLLLLGQEIEFIHKAQISFINICYILCRYYTAAAWIGLACSHVGNYPKELCARLVKPVHAVLAPCQFTSHGVMMMRAYAFTSRNRQILIFLGLCYLFLIGFNIWVFCSPVHIHQELYTLIGPTGCFPDNHDGSVARRVGYSILASAIMDLICLLIVSIQCYRMRARDVSLGRYIENQGVVAFALVYTISLTCVIMFFRFSDGAGLPMALVLPNLVACRLVLQLRQRCQPPTEIELEERNSRIVQDALNRLSSQ